MGKVEKVIVLSVLFLVALILVVTVTVDDPLDKSKVVEAGGRKAAPLVAQTPAPSPKGPAPLLSTSVQPEPPRTAGESVQQPQPRPDAAAGTQVAVPLPAGQPVAAQAPAMAAPAPAASALPPGALLKTLEGLEDSWDADLKLYTWKAGDSWRALAHTYYGDWQRLDVLKRHNEGRLDVDPGDTVFVPVFGSERGRATAAGPASAAPVAVTAASTTGAKKIHVVASGESLWKIAQSELGDGKRWQEIYAANRDILKSPESIQKGMRLRIP